MNLVSKINKILYFFALILLLILTRSWYLAVIQHDEHQQKSKQPQRRVSIEKANRGPIYDRFGIPLALNKIQYNVAIYYSHIRQIPAVRWKKTTSGEKVKVFERADYIRNLAAYLSQKLLMPAQTIEDLIHSKAALFPHTPFVLKDNISEELYYELKAQEKQWSGLQVSRASYRHYPLGKVASHVIGYLGQIDYQKHLQLSHELHLLEDYLVARQEGLMPFLPEGFDSLEKVCQKYFELQEKAYTLTDFIGKSGIEAMYENDLRGYTGRHVDAVDRHGNVLHQLEGSYLPTPGKKITLTLSAELQDFAEKLLAANEGPHLDKLDPFSPHRWMKGSAIIALDPKTAEVIAFASYPRFDPNDFIPAKNPSLRKSKQQQIQQWLETEEFIGDIWDGKKALTREYFSFVKGKYIEESAFLSFDRYLDAVFANDQFLKKIMLLIPTVQTAIELQKEETAHVLLQSVKHRQDQNLLLDLCHLIVPQELFSDDLISHISHHSLQTHFALRQEVIRILDQIEPHIRDLFHDHDFTLWRQSYFKDYLKHMRRKEKDAKKYARPYTDYLNLIETKLWSQFWGTYKTAFLYTVLTKKTPVTERDYPHLVPYFCRLKELKVSSFSPYFLQLQNTLHSMTPFLGIDYLTTFRCFKELTTPLRQKYPRMYAPKECLQKHLAAAFYPPYGYGFMKAYTHQFAAAPGSVFKLITAYTALMQQHEKNGPLNPLVITDDWRGNPSSSAFILGFLENGAPLKRNYKGGRLPKSSHPGMGKLDLQGAIEQSSNVYFSLLASDVIENPQKLAETASLFGIGKKTGIDLPLEAKGKIPLDLTYNPTGLYTFAIGQHTLETTPLQIANMLQIIANHGILIQPHLVYNIEGENRTIQHELIDRFPHKGLSVLSKPVIQHEAEAFSQTNTHQAQDIPFPAPVFESLFQGMQKTVLGKKGSARASVIRKNYDHPDLIKDYLEVRKDMIGKTGTAQVLYKTSLSSKPPMMEHYVSFGTIAYTPDSEHKPMTEKTPELVVVVMMRYRKAGLEGAPMAAQVIKKWREIKQRHDLLQG